MNTTVEAQVLSEGLSAVSERCVTLRNDLHVYWAHIPTSLQIRPVSESERAREIRLLVQHSTEADMEIAGRAQ
jgi:hypothetical protein